MPLARDMIVIKQLRLERLADLLATVDAHAHQPDAPCRQSLDRRNADLPLEAFGHDLTLVEPEKDGAAHVLAFRLAAARASRAFE
jgi:hypothetical protein